MAVITIYEELSRVILYYTVCTLPYKYGDFRVSRVGLA